MISVIHESGGAKSLSHCIAFVTTVMWSLSLGGPSKEGSREARLYANGLGYVKLVLSSMDEELHVMVYSMMLCLLIEVIRQEVCCACV